MALFLRQIYDSRYIPENESVGDILGWTKSGIDSLNLADTVHEAENDSVHEEENASGNDSKRILAHRSIVQTENKINKDKILYMSVTY